MIAPREITVGDLRGWLAANAELSDDESVDIEDVGPPPWEPVTGPFGVNPVTDDQIVAWIHGPHYRDSDRVLAWTATHEWYTPDQQAAWAAARVEVAAILNALHGAAQ